MLSASSSRSNTKSYCVTSESTSPREGVCEGHVANAGGGEDGGGDQVATAPSCFETRGVAGGVAIANYDGGVNTDHYSTVSYNPECPLDVVIPSSIDGSSVIAIDERSFYERSLTSVTMPNSVTSIGEHAFNESRLTSITLSNSVTSIGAYAFSYNQLTSVTIPNTTTSIGSGAFSANELTSVTIPSSVTSIDQSAFGNNQLTSVTIPNSVTNIEGDAFSSNQLTSVTIPSSVTSIGFRPFDYNPEINCRIPNVTSYNSSIFSLGCTTIERY